MMLSVRIKPVHGQLFTIDVQCQCGANALKDEVTGERRFNHGVLIGAGNSPALKTTLVCVCGRKYLIRPQSDHFHVQKIQEIDKMKLDLKKVVEEIRANKPRRVQRLQGAAFRMWAKDWVAALYKPQKSQKNLNPPSQNSSGGFFFTQKNFHASLLKEEIKEVLWIWE